MTFLNNILILLVAALVGGCAPGALRPNKQKSAFESALYINRAVINKQAESLWNQGYRGDTEYADFDEEEFFTSVIGEVRSEYERISGIAHRDCNAHADKVFRATDQQQHHGVIQADPFIGLMVRAFDSDSHSAGAQAYDECMIRKGYEPGSKADWDQVVRLAFARLEKQAKKSAAIIAKSPKGANAAERVFENTWRSVVVIKSGESQGSGVIVRPNVVATNCHVVDSGKIVVYKTGDRRALTDSSFAATIRKRDTQKDFCLLDVAGLWGIPANIRAYNTLKVGEDVYALGAPTGLDLSLSSGVVSQLRKAPVGRVIQTDAAISPGSSGGGLFDSDGNLVGITTAKRVAEDVEGIGFAIPADLAAGL